MSGENETKPKGTVTSIVDWMTGTIGKLTTLLVAAGGLIAAVFKIYGVLFSGPATVPDSPAPHPTPSLACYFLEVTSPQTKVPISLVKSGNLSWFDLVLKNDCDTDLFVRVEFQSVGGGITITKPENWPSYTIRAKGTLTRKVNPPNLSLLSENPQVIQILVSIYRKDNSDLLRVDTFQIEMVG